MTYSNIITYLKTYYFPYQSNSIKFIIPDYLNDEFEKFKNLDKKYAIHKNKRFLKEYFKNNNEFDVCKKFLFEKYNINEYGIKWIAKELNVSYTVMRQIFIYFGIEIRKGRNIVTNNVKKFRKEKALNESKNKTGWCSSNVIRKTAKYQRGIQGYFYNSQKNKYVWLRSTYEYIFAEWLNFHKINWDVECKSFTLSNGQLYKPDFFIFNENNELTKIIEIKGYWDNRAYKVEELKSILPNIEIILMLFKNKEINNYIIDNKKYDEKLKIWKQIRILQK